MYTHGHHESVLSSHRWRTAENSAAYLLPHLKPGMALLDIGCGPGTITADLAAIVAPAGGVVTATETGTITANLAAIVAPAGGVVTATETSEPLLELGRAEAARRGQGNIEFAVADIHRLDFADYTFDVVHAHQVLQHVADPVQALREMRRVCRPGGIVAARDSDYRAFQWHPEITELDEWLALYREVARRNGGEPDAGRRLLSWAQRAGLTDITPSASVWCFATPGDRRFWGEMWAERILESDLARQSGWAREDLRRLSKAWLTWAASTDGWFIVPHGEIVCRV